MFLPAFACLLLGQFGGEISNTEPWRIPVRVQCPSAGSAPSLCGMRAFWESATFLPQTEELCAGFTIMHQTGFFNQG